MVRDAANHDHLYYLNCVPLLRGLRGETLARLAHASRWHDVERGDYLFFQGDDALAAFVVCHGWIVITLSSADGRELVINEMHDGDLFGENSVISQAHRTTTAVARAHSAVLEIPRAAFLAALDTEPQLVRRLLELAVQRIVVGNARESALAFLDAPARVARLLREMDEQDRRAADKGYITLSQEELAQRTGLTRQTVARFLGDWRRKGWLITGRGRVMLLKRDMLLKIEDERLI